MNRAAVRPLALSEATNWWNRRASARTASAPGMVSSLSTRLAGRTAPAGKRRDAPREPGHERVQAGVRQGPVDPAVPFGLFGAEIVRAENRLHGPAPSQQPGQLLHAARARGRTETHLGLPQYGVLPRGEPHVARQRQFAARPAGTAGPRAWNLPRSAAARRPRPSNAPAKGWRRNFNHLRRLGCHRGPATCGHPDLS